MKSKALRFALIICSFLIFNSCKKEPGEGGNASITGNVWVQAYNNNGNSQSFEYVGADIDVYIVYGDGPGYDDRTKTDLNGIFKFKYLRKGKYTIYVYSSEILNTSPAVVVGPIAKKVEAEITNKKGTIDVGKFTIKD